MAVKEDLDTLFEDMLAKRGTKRKRKALAERITDRDIKTLLDKIVAIGDPADSCSDQETYVPVKPFFEFVDFVSGLIIAMGPSVQEEVLAYPDGASPYVPWVKNVQDARFHAGLLEKLP